jgi:hypothetical protein
MKRKLFLLICLLLFAACSVQTQGERVSEDLECLESCVINFPGGSIALNLDGTSVPPTSTPIAPTVTPTILPTVTPTPVLPADPYPDAPLCENNNPEKWHGLWDENMGCHYDHEHKHNPNELNNIFGQPGAWFGNPGQEISYSWQTFVGANGNYPEWSGIPAHLENVAKHNNYGWIVRKDIPQYASQWICNFREQFHAVSAAPGTTTRFHSFSLEVQICTSQGDTIIQTGGWIDFGNLEVDGNVVVLPGESDAVGDTGRRRIHFFDPPIPEFFWYGRFNRPNIQPGILGSTGFALATGDAWDVVNPQNPTVNTFFCPDFLCDKNGSTIQAHFVQVQLPNGNFDGYTDRYGLQNEDCIEVGLDCVPTIIQGTHSPAIIQYRGDAHLNEPTKGLVDFDIYFDANNEWCQFEGVNVPTGCESSGWIQFPN